MARGQFDHPYTCYLNYAYFGIQPSCKFDAPPSIMIERNSHFPSVFLLNIRVDEVQLVRGMSNIHFFLGPMVSLTALIP